MTKVTDSKERVKELTEAVILFDLILYVPVNNISVMLGRIFLG